MKSISDKVRCEVENVVATVKTREHDAIFSAMDDLVFLEMALSLRSVANLDT